MCIFATSMLNFIKKYPMSILLAIIALNLFSIAGSLRENASSLRENAKRNKIELLCSLIYLNIADLHHSPYSHFLFNLGKLMLMKFLNKIKKNDDLVLNLNIFNP